MQIILLRSRFAAAKPVTLTSRHLLLALLGFAVIVTLCAYLLSYLAARHVSLPFMGDLANVSAQDDAGKKDKYLKENLAAMASKLGEMEARLMRLDAVGERVQGLAGVKPEEFNFKSAPSNAASAPAAQPAHPHQDEKAPPDLSMDGMQRDLDSLAVDIEHRSDYMNVVESTLMTFKVKSRLLPTIQPVNVTYNASGFGWRTDPFTGHNAFHEGIDFPSPVGTPIVAAAGGVVITSEYHHEYGNMLEIDHGNDIVTRYAHTSKILVNVGDIVRRGQHVADIGSTGRSTGAHLHFEVLVRGMQQDPHKFLSAGAEQARALLANSEIPAKIATVASNRPGNPVVQR
jgi:murein DD-endopeptidase MepM/ murein hydrolase activator NlpD